MCEEQCGGSNAARHYVWLRWGVCHCGGVFADEARKAAVDDVAVVYGQSAISHATLLLGVVL